MIHNYLAKLLHVEFHEGILYPTSSTCNIFVKANTTLSIYSVTTHLSECKQSSMIEWFGIGQRSVEVARLPKLCR